MKNLFQANSGRFDLVPCRLRAARGLAMFLALLPLMVCGSLNAGDTFWTGAVDNDFFNAGNWSGGVPNAFDDRAVVDGGNNLPIVIPAGTGTVNIGAVQLGLEELGGSIIQNGGTLVINGDDLVEKSSIGVFGDQDSFWVMNNDATILYDNPLGGGGNGLDTDGSGLDFEVGENVPEGAVGRLEMHGNSVFRVSDDLKLSDGGAGNSVLLMDGDSKMTIGSGVSVSGVAHVTIAGNALFVTGNSADPGDSQNGRTNEGYLTLSVGATEEATVEVVENGRIYTRTLQQRNGLSDVTLRGNGQLHVFEVFENAEPSLGQATVTGSAQGPQRTSNLSELPTAETFIRLFDSASMSIDSDLEDSPWSGLALSGGNNRGANTEGGYTMIEVNDQASFAVHQDLNMTLGTGESAESVLKVRGPGATVNIGGNLRMALNEFDDENPGSAILQAVITDSTHSTISVGGSALIGNGQLLVQLDGYTPTGGETYQLLTAEQVVGSEFLSTSLPALPEGLSWNLVIGGTSIDLLVSSPFLLGDFNGNGVLDIDDIDALTAQSALGTNPAAYDLNADALVNVDDVNLWVTNLKNSWIGDANLDGEFNSSDLVVVLASGTYEADVASVWSTGDFNGDGRTNSTDLVSALADGGYETGPRAAVAAVPEPASGWLLAIAIVVGTAACRRRR